MKNIKTSLGGYFALYRVVVVSSHIHPARLKIIHDFLSFRCLQRGAKRPQEGNEPITK